VRKFQSAVGCLLERVIVPAVVMAFVMSALHEPSQAELLRRIVAIETARAPNIGPPLVEQRVLDLPEDGNQWHTSLFVRPDWRGLPAERRAEAMFHSEPLLASLKAQTHWHLTTTDAPEFDKFRALVTATPCLLLQRANGEVVYRESGPELGHEPHSLTHAIRKEIQRHCPDGRCLPLHPRPGPDERGPADEIPAVLKEEPKPADRKSLGGAIVAALAGLAGGAAGNWRKNG
jgi:hypothetical protein